MNRGGPQTQLNLTLTPAVKWLIITNVAIWFGLQVIADHYFGLPFSKYFALIPADVLKDFFVWQPFTYMFLHTLQITHILFNMLMLWFMGVELEQRWGRKFFITFYILSGAGAALIYIVGTFIYFMVSKTPTNALVVPVMGASGAIFGLMMAYGILFGERTIHFMMVFPMKAKYFVMILGAIELSSLLTSDVNGGDVAYLAHLGGLASGYLVLKGHGRFQRVQWNMKAKKKSRNLRLVVDNEKRLANPVKVPSIGIKGLDFVAHLGYNSGTPNSEAPCH